MVDRTLLAKKMAAVLDATQRVRSILPAQVDDFERDRTVREVVVLNLFVALQGCLDLASHWVSDEGWDVPSSYRELFQLLATHAVIDAALAQRLVAASGFRNLVAHQYGALDWRRVYDIACVGPTDLDAFCAALASRAGEPPTQPSQ